MGRSPNTSVHSTQKVQYKQSKPVKEIKDNEDWPESSAGTNMLQKVPTSNSIVLTNRFKPLLNTVNADDQKLTKKSNKSTQQKNHKILKNQKNQQNQQKQ